MSFPDYTPTAPVFLHHIAEKYGDRELIVAGDERLGYRELEQRSAHLARGLLARGVGKATRVGILMGNGPNWVLAFAAVTRIGAVAVPINTFYQRSELLWILRHADVHTLLTLPGFLSHDYLARLEDAAPSLATAPPGAYHLPELPYLRQIIVWGACDRAWALDGTTTEAEGREEAGLDADFLAAVEEQVLPSDIMLTIYSSGSTAEPKGALHSHGAVIRHSHNLLAGRDIRGDDRIWSPMPFFWVGGLSFALLGSMHTGACMLCEDHFDPETTLAFLERERASVALGWPHFGKALSEHPSFASRDLSTLRGGNIPNILPETIVPNDLELRPNALGMTETLGPHTRANAGVLPEHLRASFGPPVDGVEHKIVDPETGATLPHTEVGELCVRGYSLMQGLYKIEREDTFDSEGYYHTGDAGCFSEDDILYFKGRLGDMIKTAGANVTPSEVEQILMALPEVKAAFVVGVPDGDRGQAVAASVLLEQGAHAEAEALRARIKKEISAYKVPKYLFVEQDGSLPFTDTGKIDKRKLAALLEARISRS